VSLFICRSASNSYRWLDQIGVIYVKTFLGAVSVLASVLLVALPTMAEAGDNYGYNNGYGQQRRAVKKVRKYRAIIQYADSYDNEYPVTESQAAYIAQQNYPEAKVLKVKLLQSGVYAVTLKDGGNVSRVLVDATSGEILG
jgi:Peptidase propeptide and YPEB domain